MAVPITFGGTEKCAKYLLSRLFQRGCKRCQPGQLRRDYSSYENNDLLLGKSFNQRKIVSEAERFIKPS